MKLNKIIPFKLFSLLNKKQKIYLLILLIATIILSLIETLGISIIMPFISVASNPAILDSGRYNQIFIYSGIDKKSSFIIIFGLLIIAFYFFRSIFNVSYVYFSIAYTKSIFRYLSGKLFQTYLTIPYKIYSQKNTADFRTIISAESNNVSTILLSFIQILSEFFTVFLIYIFMIIINWQMTLIITFILLFLALIIINIFFKKTKIQGVKKSEAAKKLNRILEETFGNFKFMKLKGNDKQIIDVYKNSVTVYAQAETISETIGILPKNILENLGFSLIIAAIIYIIWRYDSADKVIPIISMYALALYRILPAVFKILQNINKLVYYQYSLNMVYENINQATEEEGNQDITFGDQINFNDVSFNYVSNHEILKNVSFDIKKGEKIAFSGESGSGKTTLVDLIIGLNKPVSGTIAVDNIIITNKNIRSWRKKIGYIPQNIYLFDGTVAENITFGSDFNQDQLINALKTANIWDFLSQKEGIHTRVGEGGNQLSGGQKQRIGIARALYNNPEILVLDEATSALDYETEEKIMNEIYNISKDKTLIVIAHRISTLKNCNKIININKGIISIDEKIL